jgi:hypothetical protein
MNVRNVIAGAGAVANAAGRVIPVIAGVLLMVGGLFIGIAAAIGLAMPDPQLIKTYVEVIAGTNGEAVARAVPMLGPVMIGVRIILIVALLEAVSIVKHGRQCLEGA